MAVPFRPLFRMSGIALIGSLILSACSQGAGETKASETETATAAPAVSGAETLAPDALFLRALECRSSLAPLRNGNDLLPTDVMARVAASANVSFGDLVFGSDARGNSPEARSQAHSSGRPTPRTAADVTPEYLDYVTTCADILDRTATVLSEAAAAKL